MSNADNQVECQSHGLQERTFVCQHIVQSLHTRLPVGFFVGPESTEARPDASCNICNDARESAGGEWTDEVMKIVQLKILCGACYDEARELWRNRPRDA